MQQESIPAHLDFLHGKWRSSCPVKDGGDKSRRANCQPLTAFPGGSQFRHFTL